MRSWAPSVGLVVGTPASLDYRRLLRLTIGEQTVVVALAALVCFLAVNILRTEAGIGALIVLIIVLVGAPALIFIDLRKKSVE